jgi:hypothetical protein
MGTMAATSQVNIRCTEEQHARWSAAAKKAQRKLADWARLQIDRGADEAMIDQSVTPRPARSSGIKK